MSLLRALSKSKGGCGGGDSGGGGDGEYDKLQDKNNKNNNSSSSSVVGQYKAVLKRAQSVPVRVLFGTSKGKFKSSSSSLSQTTSPLGNNSEPSKQSETNKGGKAHPVFGLFDGRSWSKKKLTNNTNF
ncbi:hypothetical protein RND81_02G140600 [Saponaria officinalis]|uniref:Uncharacterized protein n=1 Tax=Saponaria officinalis TaxID=3572 RepID=A0AAW1MLE9_SAPOF